MQEGFITKCRKWAHHLIIQYESSRFILSLRYVTAGIVFPMAVAGSIFYIAANPPRGTDIQLFKIWLSSALKAKNTLMIPYYLTYGMISLVFTAAFSYKLASEYATDPVLSSVVSSLSFLGLCIPRVTGGTSLQGITVYTGPGGVFTAILISVCCINIIKLIFNNKLYFNIVTGLSPSYSIGFKYMFPVMAIIPCFWLFGWIFSHFTGFSFANLVITSFNSIISSASGLLSDLLSAFFSSVSCFIGLDGNLLEHPAYNMLISPGGIGALLPLTIMFIFSSSKQLKQIGKSIIIPLIFNIPFPMIYGAPILLNPIYLVPFMLYPAAAVLINHAVLSLNAVTVTIEATSTTPVLLSGYFITCGSFAGILLQLVNMVLAGFIYYPFFKYHESKLLNMYEIDMKKQKRIS